MLPFGLAAALALTPPSAPEVRGRAVELQWTAPASCPEVARVHELVSALVPAGSGVEPRLRAISTVEQVPGGFEGSLELVYEGRRTTRALRADDCVLLARAMAVVVAVSLDPIATVEELRRVPQVPPSGIEPLAPGTRPSGSAPARPSGSADARPSGSAPARPSGSAPAGSAPARPSGSAPAGSALARPSGSADALARPSGRLEWGARAGLGLGGLLLPAPGVGLVLAPFVGTARLHVRAVAQYWAPQRVALDVLRDASGELQLVTGGLRICPALVRDRVRVPLCVGADAGAMLGEGTGRDLSATRSAQQPWVGAVLQPGASIDLTPRLSLWLALEGVISLYRPVFGIEGASQEWTAGAGDVRGLVGVELHARREKP